MSHETTQRLTGLQFTLYAPADGTRLHPAQEAVAEFEQVGSTRIRVAFDYEPGQEAITNRDPDYCQEGFGESFDITAIENLEPVTLDCNGMTLTIPAGFDLLNLIGTRQAGMVLDSLYDRDADDDCPTFGTGGTTLADRWDAIKAAQESRA